MNLKKLNLRKESGNYQAFSKIKFINSLRRSGIDNEVAEDILRQLKPKLSDGITTKRLYKMAYKLINRESKKAASRYGLPRALLALGPDGFNFERFVAEVMSRLGYEVKVGVILKGKCVSHEIDVIAKKGNKTIYMECKFHNSLGYKEDIKTALYVNARKMDLRENKSNNFEHFWLVTNARFTLDALTYANCSGLVAVSPYEPEGMSLYDLIVKANAHPIGCLNQLKNAELKQLVSHGVLFIRDLLSKPRILSRLGFNEKRVEIILKEARTICSPF